MSNKTDRGQFFAASLRVMAMLALILTSAIGAAMPSLAQSGTSNIAVVTTANGNPYYDACFVLVDYSQVGCDVNRDGKITFEAIPYGTYTLRQTQSLGGGLYVNDTTITVTGAASSDGWERFYVSVAGGGSTSTGSSNVAVVTTENGQFFLDACFVLVDYSQVGCDVNRDGKITFEAIPYGTYTLRQTVNLPGGRYVNDTTITVTGAADADGWERFYVSVVGGGSSGSSGVYDPDLPIDISLITRDPDTGGLLTDVCYVLVGYSNVGCDENNDGQVTFAQIPPGTYTVRQTQIPAGYPAINDFEINVMPLGELPGGEIWQIPLGFIVRQAPEQNAPGTLNVSILFIDYATGKKVDTGICVQMVGASNVGCDSDLKDGQVDFLDVPEGGPYSLEFSNLPPGMTPGVGLDSEQVVWIQPDTYPHSIVFGFILLGGSGGTVGGNTNPTSGTSNVAVVTSQNGQNFLDACYVLVDYSQVGCDVNRDGKITFEDIPYGTYTLRQTQSLGGGRYVNDTTITVTGAADADGWERFYVNVVGGGGSSGGSSGGSGTSNIAVVTTQNGQFYLDACFVLVDYSQVGCDVNRDGKITFEAIPYGTYTLRQTQSLPGGRYVSDRTITVTGAADSDGWERFYVTVQGGSSSSDLPDEMALLSPTEGQRSLRRQRRIA